MSLACTGHHVQRFVVQGDNGLSYSTVIGWVHWAEQSSPVQCTLHLPLPSSHLCSQPHALYTSLLAPMAQSHALYTSLCSPPTPVLSHIHCTPPSALPFPLSTTTCTLHIPLPFSHPCVQPFDDSSVTEGAGPSRDPLLATPPPNPVIRLISGRKSGTHTPGGSFGGGIVVPLSSALSSGGIAMHSSLSRPASGSIIAKGVGLQQGVDVCAGSEACTMCNAHASLQRSL